jgi:glutamine synthetase
LAIVRRTALSLGLPLQSLEIELGPSQFEAVFAPTDALAAADHMLLFATTCGKPCAAPAITPASSVGHRCPNAVASGWHLHHSLLDAQGANAFAAGHGFPVIGRPALAGRLARPRTGHGRAVRAHHPRLQPFPGQPDGPAGGSLGP